MSTRRTIVGSKQITMLTRRTFSSRLPFSPIYHDLSSTGGVLRSGQRITQISIEEWRRSRWASSTTGENQTGHITAGKNEGILFFDNLFPLKLNWLLRLPGNPDKSLSDTLWRYNNQTLAPYDPLSMVKRAIPKSTDIEVIEILPRLKDAGCFVKFSHPESVTAEDVEKQVARHLKEHPVRPWYTAFLSSGINSRLVLGKPWLEDLFRFPSRRVKVEFVPPSPEKEAAELSQETLYGLFRKYGKLLEIRSQPFDSKEVPKYAYIIFANIRPAVMARNCMHGFKIAEAAGGGKDGTLLRLSYEQKQRARAFRDWIFAHPRVTLPILAAILATVAVAIFDPIRTFFIKAHIDHAFQITDSMLYKWFKRQANDILSFRRRHAEDPGYSAIWEGRKQAIGELSNWLMDADNTFIVIEGPRGSGKRELVMDFALKDRADTLYIDCKPIQEARGDSGTIAAAAKAVGYRPVFSWMNSMSSLLDLAAQGTIGVKSGLSETLDTQLAKIWQNTAVALKQVALKHRKKDGKDASLSDDDWLEAHPEFRPVVVVDNFLHKSEESSVVYDKLSEWAARLTTSNIAHIVFLTNDISYSKHLGKALPDRVFRQVALGDLSPENAKGMVIKRLEASQGDRALQGKLTTEKVEVDLENLDESIEILGGRLTDLEFFVRRLQTGQTPRQAVAEIVEQNASEVMKMYLLSSVYENDRKWSPEQAWYLVRALAENDNLRFNEVLLSNTFGSSLTASSAGSVTALEALSASELISIKTHKGRPQSITPGKPVYQAAFRLLTEDHVLKSRFDLAILKELAAIEAKNIAKCEEELKMLGALPKQSSETAPRVQYLLSSLAASQVKVEGWEKDMGGLKKVLMNEY